LRGDGKGLLISLSSGSLSSPPFYFPSCIVEL
jgi:hypothetical protein